MTGMRASSTGPRRLGNQPTCTVDRFIKQVERQFNGRESALTLLDKQPSTLWALLPAMHCPLGAPLGGKAADCFVDILTESPEIADYAPAQESAVGVGVAEVGGQKILVAELVRNPFGHEQPYWR